MKKYKQALTYSGFVLAIVAVIGYLILLWILISGFKIEIGNDKLMIFLGLGAVAGVLISLSLRIQGIDFAKAEEEAKNALNEYNDLITKDKKKKMYPLWVFMLVSTIKDIVFKGLSVFVTLYFSITVIVEGMGDYTYFLLGLVNVVLYLGLGFLSLAKAYDNYLEKHIPYLKQKTIRMKEELDAEENTRVDSGNHVERRLDSGVSRVSKRNRVKLNRRLSFSSIKYQ